MRVALALSLILSASCASAPALRGVGGERLHVPADGADATVVLFVMVDCPISNAYMPELGRICEEYRARGVAFVAAYSDPTLDGVSVRVHARDYKLKCPAVLDRDGSLARRLGATMVPTAVVLRRDGSVAYLGRIDDRWVDYKRQRQKPTTRDLRDALEAVLAGRAVAAPATPVVGCFIPEPEGGRP